MLVPVSLGGSVVDVLVAVMLVPVSITLLLVADQEVVTDTAVDVWLVVEGRSTSTTTFSTLASTATPSFSSRLIDKSSILGGAIGFSAAGADFKLVTAFTAFTGFLSMTGAGNSTPCIAKDSWIEDVSSAFTAMASTCEASLVLMVAFRWRADVMTTSRTLELT
eukprot:TRINITY_DN7657_c0_g1_i9.p2 TRINITY_DN7657_c0_g1~~TRINITY_DN7657_c0_g1_i9.p2  ORF type:complete len:164 (+),score=26.88 TRINITY_DN7657_c0_g1_i9:587-1078(+)